MASVRIGALLVRTHLASTEEPDAGEAIEKVFAEDGVTAVVLQAVPAAVRRNRSRLVEVIARAAGMSRKYRAARRLVATGRHPGPRG